MNCRSIVIMAALALCSTVMPNVAFGQQPEQGVDARQATAPSEEATPDEQSVASDVVEEQAEEEDISDPSAKSAPARGDVKGPGGRVLRSDYPGTKESLQANMDTARIEGVSIQDGQRPDEIYDLRVKELETKIDDLKERVFRSKSRIVLLKETVLSGNLAGSRVIITHESKLGSVYKIRRGLFSIDGNRIFNQIDRDGDLAAKRSLDIYNGTTTPGTHTVSIVLGLQGSGFGMFSYAKGYEFNVRSSCQFTAEEGKTTLLSIVTYEKGNAFTAHEDRPDVQCHVSMVDLTAEDLPENVAAPSDAVSGE